jgi:hypothetical protein
MCGYHWFIANANPKVYYAVMPYPGCAGCQETGQPDLVNLTIISSHELCESITDPEPWSGWNDSNNGEIGDICAWKVGTIGPYTVQL